MRQFAGLIIAFIMLPVMLKVYPKITGKKAPLGPILAVTGLIMAVIGGLGPKNMLDALVRVFTTFSSLQTLIVVLEIGILGSILKQYGILDKIVGALEQLIPSKKVLIMILPAIMGLLPVPGGAFLSAPFVDSLGTSMNMSGERKTVINLYFRHFSSFVLPYSTTMLAIATALNGVNVYTLILLNMPFVLAMMIGAYFMYVRSAPEVRAEGRGDAGKAIKDVLIYMSPIYMAFILNAVVGLQMYQSIFLCILLTFFIIGKDKSKYLSSFLKGIDIGTVLMLTGVYFMQNIVKQLDVVMSSVGGLLSGSSVITFMLIVPLVGLAFGLSTGISLVPMGILLPFVAGMNLSPMAQMVYASYILCWCFFGYYYSPFHMCQLLTVKYVGCDTGAVYKLHTRMIPVLALAAMGSFLLYNLILL